MDEAEDEMDRSGAGPAAGTGAGGVRHAVRGDAAGGVEQTGDKTGEQTAEERAEQCEPRVNARGYQNDADCAAGRKRAVNGKVGYIEYTKGYVYADSHDTPYQTLRNYARHRTAEGLKEV